MTNWGRWGPDDQLGTLNLITAEHRRAATALVRTGHAVSCARELTPGHMPYAVGATAVQRYMVRSGEGVPDTVPAAGASEYLGLVFHGRYVTHLDSPAHVFRDGRLYNDVPAARVTTAHGARTHAVTVAGDGIITRGVLLDVARHRGVAELPDGAAVTVAELESVAGEQGVAIAPGDAVLLRTGHAARVRGWRAGDLPITGYAGWAAECVPWLHERDVAVVGADTAQDPVPAPSGGLTSPLHVLGIVDLGLWLLDNCDLDALADAAQRENRWEFLLCIAPLRLDGGTGIPVNPIAIF